ncbi:MAG: hypothetical protein WDN08_22305 [Rhizomicrobium sp.]
MAHIVLGLGSSHTPLLILPADEWIHRADADRKNPKLSLSDGRYLSYEALKAEVGERHAGSINLPELQRKEEICQRALDHLADALEAAAPDVAIIIGDDQEELFNESNQPALSIFYGSEVVTSRWHALGGRTEPWLRKISEGYLMDQPHVLPGAPELALDIIKGLLDGDIDVSVSRRVDAASEVGFGHAFGFIVNRLFRGRSTPILPVLLNTYYPPNVLSSRRCHDVGKALRRAIEASPLNCRVAVIASGGLSHFVVDEGLDRKIIGALSTGEEEVLRNIPRGALNSGSSEILNWILAAGALDHLPLTWSEYQPLYRTAIGTGVGVAFAIWSGKQAA